MIYSSISRRNGDGLEAQTESALKQIRFAMLTGSRAIRYGWTYTQNPAILDQIREVVAGCASLGLRSLWVMPVYWGTGDKTISPTRPPEGAWRAMLARDQDCIDAICEAYSDAGLDPVRFATFMLGCELGDGGVNGTKVWNGTSWVSDPTRVSGTYDALIKRFLVFRATMTDFRGCPVAMTALECENPVGTDGLLRSGSGFATELSTLFVPEMKAAFDRCSLLAVNCYPAGKTPSLLLANGEARFKVITSELRKRSALPVVLSETGVSPERCSLSGFSGLEPFWTAHSSFCSLWRDSVVYQIQDHRSDEGLKSFGLFDFAGAARPLGRFVAKSGGLLGAAL